MILALNDLWGWDPPKLGLEVMIVPFREIVDKDWIRPFKEGMYSRRRNVEI